MRNQRQGGQVPVEEQAYWREQHLRRSGEGGGGSYSYEQDYEPAYRYGWEAQVEYPDRHWEDIEDELEHNWEERRYHSRLSWREAREACQDAWGHYLREHITSDQPRPGEEPV